MGETTDRSETSALIEALHRQIDRALDERRWRFADYFCDRILGEDPRDLRAWLLKGHLANHRFNDADGALHCYRKVIVLGGWDSADALVTEARNALESLLDRLS